MSSPLATNDKRTVRTRNLIVDAFLSLANEKPFEDITVKDISEKAAVNRATFYAHFQDKYDLLNCFTVDKFMVIVAGRIDLAAELNEETLKNIILIMCDCHQTISNNYAKLYQSAAVLIDSRVQFKLQEIILNILSHSKVLSHADKDKIELLTVMISSGIYCVTKRWHSKGNTKNLTILTEEILPFMISGGITGSAH